MLPEQTTTPGTPACSNYTPFSSTIATTSTPELNPATVTENPSSVFQSDTPCPVENYLSTSTHASDQNYHHSVTTFPNYFSHPSLSPNSLMVFKNQLMPPSYAASISLNPSQSSFTTGAGSSGSPFNNHTLLQAPSSSASFDSYLRMAGNAYPLATERTYSASIPFPTPAAQALAQPADPDGTIQMMSTQPLSAGRKECQTNQQTSYVRELPSDLETAPSWSTVSTSAVQTVPDLLITAEEPTIEVIPLSNQHHAQETLVSEVPTATLSHPQTTFVQNSTADGKRASSDTEIVSSSSSVSKKVKHSSK